MADEVHALHGLVDYKPQFGQVTNTNYAAITRIGNVVTIDGTHGGGIVVWRAVLNGEFVGANSSSAFAALGHAGLMLTEGHKYSAKLTYISGSATRADQTPNQFCFLRVYKNSNDDPPVAPADVAYTVGTDGKNHECTFTYDSTLTATGVLLTLCIQRSNGSLPTFANYKVCVTLEDITDAVTPVTDVQVNGTSVVSDGVANVPIATISTLGVVMASDGLQMSSAQNGKIMLAPASSAQIKGGIKVNVTNDISKQHESVFYGLAKAAGDTTQSASSNAVGQYTESAKSAIHTMLSGSVSVSGTTPTITALPGLRYICGEVTTLDITLPASGCIDVVFQSGSTATVLTVTPPTGVTVRWANSFDPTALEADTTYEINVCDGLGVAGAWT